MSERLHYFSPDASVPITFDTDSSDAESLDSGLPLAPAFYDPSRRPCSVSDRSSLHAAQLQLWCDEARRRRAPAAGPAPAPQHDRRTEPPPPPPRSASAKSLRIRITPSSSSLSLASDLDAAPASAAAAPSTPLSASWAFPVPAAATAAPGPSPPVTRAPSHAKNIHAAPNAAGHRSSMRQQELLHNDPQQQQHHQYHHQQQLPSSTVAAARVPLPYVPPTPEEDALTDVDSIPPSPPSRAIRSSLGRMRTIRWSSFLARRTR